MSKLKLFFVLSMLLGGSLLNTQPSAAQTKTTPALFCALGTDKDKARHKKGAEVGTRVRQLRKHNKNVDRALADFERNEKRNGNKPRIDESESFTIDAAGGTAALKPAAKSPFRNVSYKPQDGYGLEVIVIPTYEAPGEWQGTVIYNKLDLSGNYLGEYVANVIIGPDPTYTLPDVILEISYEDGQAYLEYGDVYDGELGDPGLLQLANRVNWPLRSIFKKASFQNQPGRLALAKRIVQNPKVRSYVKCTWSGSGAGAAACGVVSAFFAGTPFIPCLLGAGTGANVYCVITTIFP